MRDSNLLVASTTATTAVQVWTLVVAGLAVVASVYAAVLLRRTGKGTVKAAMDAADASKNSAEAAERTAEVAVASLTEAMAVSASAPAEEFFLAHLIERRTELQHRLDAMWSINFQLAAVMLTADRRDWESDLPSQSPASLKLPEVTVDPSITSALPMALSAILALVTAWTARFEAIKATASDDECWRLLRAIQIEARKGREVLDKTLGGVQSAEARVTSEIRETRNSIGQWRRERHQATLGPLGAQPTTPPAESPEESSEE